MKRFSSVLAGVLTFGIAASAAAATFSLQDLVDGTVTSFQSDNGQLTFSDFDVTKLKKLSNNLELYTVTTVDDGFVLTSTEFTATTKGLKKLNLTYVVRANADALITGAEMEMAASRQSGRVKVEKDIEGIGNDDEGTFLLTLLRNGRSDLVDSDTFEPGSVAFEVEEAIRIKRVATLEFVRNSYSTNVPEAPVLSLMLAGVAGLAAYGRRRSA